MMQQQEGKDKKYLYQRIFLFRKGALLVCVFNKMKAYFKGLTTDSLVIGILRYL